MRISLRTSLFVFALVLRIAALCLPSFSTDTRRFLADGINVTQGKNPYTAPPPIAIDYPHLRSFYPPLQEAAFGLLAKIYPDPMVFRLFGGAFEIAFLLWFFWKKRRKKVSNVLLLFLLFNPVSLHEIWREGHVDHIAAIFLYAAILSLRAGKSARAYLFAFLSIGWKFIGIFAAAFQRFTAHSPLMSLVKRAVSPFTLFCAAVFTLQFIPALLATPFAEQGLTVYRQYWHHGNALIDLFAAYGFHPAHGVYLVQRLILLLLAFFTALYLAGRLKFYDAFYLSLGTLLVLFPSQHPWYYFLLFPAILLSRRWRPVMVIVCVLSPLSYFGYTQSLKAVGFIAVLAAWLAGCIIHFTRRTNYRLRWRRNA